MLHSFSFRGFIKHLEGFYVTIEAPRLKHIHLEFPYPVIFDVSTISLSIGSKELFNALDQAHMILNGLTVEITLSSRNGTLGGRLFMLIFECNDSGWRLRSMTQDRRPFSPRSGLASFDRLNDLSFKDLAKSHRKRPMARTFAVFRLCRELVPLQGSCSTRRTCHARTCCQGRCGNAGVARATKPFHRSALVFENAPRKGP